MALSSDYFERIIEAVKSSKRAYDNRDMEEAAEYMGEVRSNRDENDRLIEDIHG